MGDHLMRLLGILLAAACYGLAALSFTLYLADTTDAIYLAFTLINLANAVMTTVNVARSF